MISRHRNPPGPPGNFSLDLNHQQIDYIKISIRKFGRTGLVINIDLFSGGVCWRGARIPQVHHKKITLISLILCFKVPQGLGGRRRGSFMIFWPTRRRTSVPIFVSHVILSIFK